VVSHLVTDDTWRWTVNATAEPKYRITPKFIFLSSECLRERLVTLLEKCCTWLSDSMDKLKNRRTYDSGDFCPIFCSMFSFLHWRAILCAMKAITYFDSEIYWGLVLITCIHLTYLKLGSNFKVVVTFWGSERGRIDVMSPLVVSFIVSNCKPMGSPPSPPP